MYFFNTLNKSKSRVLGLYRIILLPNDMIYSSLFFSSIGFEIGSEKFTVLLDESIELKNVITNLTTELVEYKNQNCKNNCTELIMENNTLKTTVLLLEERLECKIENNELKNEKKDLIIENEKLKYQLLLDEIKELKMR